MPKLRIHSIGVSLDGYAAGPAQSRENPLGLGGSALLAWMMATRTQQRLLGNDEGTTGIHDDFAALGFENIGAWIIGRNMFGPVRGSWPDESWKGWWGENPPFHTPLFVLTHHPRASFSLEGGTSFHFVTEGIQSAVERASAAAGGKDVRVGGGSSTIRQFLLAGLIDELHFAIAPVLLGSGEPLFAGLDLPSLGYQCIKHVPAPGAMHVILARRG